jgi:hypothetical protein
MQEEQLNETQEDSLNLSFHRTFALSRSGVASVMTAIAGGAASSKNSIHANTTLGTIQVEAMPRYAERMGLLNNVKNKKNLTVFGQLALVSDPTLSDKNTQWAMHYFISAPHRQSPNFWYQLVTECLVPDAKIEMTKDGEKANDIITKTLSKFSSDKTGKTPADKTLNGTVKAFLGTYSKEEALGNLGLLQTVNSTAYQVLDPALPVAGTFACLLADYWEQVWPGRADVLLSDLTAGPLARLLLAEGRLGPLLREVERLGLVRVQRRVPPYQVFRLWDDPAAVWQQHLYPARS